MTKYCVSCGASNPNTASVCAKCGKVLGTGNVETGWMDSKPILEKTENPISEERTNNGIMKAIAIAVLCVVIVILYSYYNDRGIVGTWKSDEIVYGDDSICYIMSFNDDNTGVLSARDGGDAMSFGWSEIEKNKYMLIFDSYEFEDKYILELSSNNFVINSGNDWFNNIVFHRE